eukprot:3178726-Rhodomonas_salina.1
MRWSTQTKNRKLKETDYEVRRTVSLDLRALQPGDYVVMVSTFDPAQEMNFYMNFYSSQAIGIALHRPAHTGSRYQNTIAMDTVDMANRRAVGDLLSAEVFPEADLLDGYTDRLQSKEVDR